MYWLYELSNHPGNVTTFSENIETREEKKTVGGSVQTTLYQVPEIVAFTDYTPFGLNVAFINDNALTSTYRYGFNGKEQDDNGEWGDLTHYDYGFRIYNPAIARFLSVDPLSPEYPELTPYQFASNTPIWAIDLDGLEAVFIHGTFADRSTWDDDFTREMIHATGWGLIQDDPVYGDWSNKNSVEARMEGVDKIYKQLTKDNVYSEMKRATLIAHSHGGNVVKELKNRLESEGWTIDLINIATPQRKDFTTGPSEKGKYLNFYSNFDPVQYIGTNDDAWFTPLYNNTWLFDDNKGGTKLVDAGRLGSYGGSRKDSNADTNIQIDFYKGWGKTLIPFYGIFKWWEAGKGHSYHNNTRAQEMIIEATQKYFGTTPSSGAQEPSSGPEDNDN